MATAPSERLKKLPEALLENRGSMYQAMQAVGYSENYAANPAQLRATTAYAEVMTPIVEQLEERRRAAIKRLTDQKLDKANATAITGVIDTLTKNIQLLTGKATERHSLDLSLKTDAELTELSRQGDSGTGQKGIGPSTPD